LKRDEFLRVEEGHMPSFKPLPPPQNAWVVLKMTGWKKIIIISECMNDQKKKN
jgi:hypothetical protein